MDRPKGGIVSAAGAPAPTRSTIVIKNKSSGLRTLVTTSSRSTTNTRPNNQNHSGSITIPSHPLPSSMIPHCPSPFGTISYHSPPSLTIAHLPLPPLTINSPSFTVPSYSPPARSSREPCKRSRFHTPGEHREWIRTLREWIPLRIPRGSAVRRTRTTHRKSYRRRASSE